MLFVDVVMAAPDVLSVVVAASMINVPVPRAPALLISKLAPESRVTPPLKLLFPDKANAPEPVMVRLSPTPVMAPPTVKVLADTVTVGLAVKVTAPLPRYKEDEPAKVKLPAQVCILLLVDVVIAALEVLSMVVPPSMVNVPEPKAPALLISKVPVLKVRPPLKLLFPDRTSVPAAALVIR